MEHEIKQDGLQLELQEPVAHPATTLMHPRAESTPQVAKQTTPADMVMYALQNGGSLEQVRELMQMRREWESDEARKAFNAARAAFKAESIVLTKDRENKQYKSMYTTLGNLVSTVTPFLSKHGLSADWAIDQVSVPGQITVVCVLSHAQGHSEKVQFTVPPDTAGAKNPIQQIKSSITYAKSVTFESVCGMAATDANLDDDGGEPLDRNAVRDAVAERRAKDTPTTVRGRREGQEKPAGDPPPELVKLAKESAAVGITQYGKFWKNLTQGERNQLLPMHDEFQKIANSIGQG